MTVDELDTHTAARHRLGFLLRPGWLGAIVGALAFTAACWLILAPWQFSRHAERDAQNAAITAALTSQPVSVDQYLSVSAEPAADGIWREVTATGVFDPQSQVYARLRQDNAGNPAAEVIVPLRLDDGTTLMVDRGYMPDADVRAGKSAPDLPAGRVTVVGRVQNDQPDPKHRAPERAFGHVVVYGIDSAALAGPGTPVRQGFIQLVAGTPGGMAEIGLPQIDGGPFLSYALQWCAFGGMALLAMGYFIYREATHPIGADEDDESCDREDGPTGGADGRTAQPVRGEPSPPQPATIGGTERKARSRDGFDKSQLYD